MWETLFTGTLLSVRERFKDFLEQIYSTQVSKVCGLESSSFIHMKFNIWTFCFELGFYITLTIQIFSLYRATESGDKLVE